MEKYCRVGQATDDNMAHAHCMFDTKGYKYTIRIGLCISYYFYTFASGFMRASECYFILTLPVLLTAISVNCTS